jgi:hypothetical protein
VEGLDLLEGRFEVVGTPPSTVFAVDWILPPPSLSPPHANLLEKISSFEEPLLGRGEGSSSPSVITSNSST